MSISFSPGGAQWDSISYGMFRRRLAALDGIDLDKMRGFTADPLPRDWEDYPTALEPLLNSSDVHGFISGTDCGRMLPRLRAVLHLWESQVEARRWTQHATEDALAKAGQEVNALMLDMSRLRALIVGMEHCAEHGCALTYG